MDQNRKKSVGLIEVVETYRKATLPLSWWWNKSEKIAQCNGCSFLCTVYTSGKSDSKVREIIERASSKPECRLFRSVTEKRES